MMLYEDERLPRDKGNNYSRSNALSISETMKGSNDFVIFFFLKRVILIQTTMGYKRYVQILELFFSVVNPRYAGVNFPLFTDVYFA